MILGMKSVEASRLILDMGYVGTESVVRNSICSKITLLLMRE